MSGVRACNGGEGLVSYLPSVTGGGAAFKARGFPPICCANRFPPRPLTRRFRFARAALTTAPPPPFSCVFSILGTDLRSVSWQMFQPYRKAQTG
jgi:hypothetical protein